MQAGDFQVSWVAEEGLGQSAGVAWQMAPDLHAILFDLRLLKLPAIFFASEFPQTLAKYILLTH